MSGIFMFFNKLHSMVPLTYM